MSGLCLTSKFHKDFSTGYCSSLCEPTRAKSCGETATCIYAGAYICARACSTSADCLTSQLCMGKMCVPSSVQMDFPRTFLINDGDKTLTRISESVSLWNLAQSVATLAGRGLFNIIPNPPAPPSLAFEPPSDDAALPFVPGNAGGWNIKPIRSRAVGHPDHERARAWIVSQLEGMHLSVEEQVINPFTVDDDMGGSLLPTRTLVNIRAVFPGSAVLPRILVVAHYDSRAFLTKDYDAVTDPAPGAGDNATGVAAVLEIARILTSEVGQLRRTVEFVLLDGAEPGWSGMLFDAYGGARGYLSRALAQPKPFVTLNLDSIAWKTAADPSHVWIGFGPDVGIVGRLGIEAVRDHTKDFPMITTRDDAFFTRSDHLAFERRGWPTVFVYSWPASEVDRTALDTTAKIDWLKYLRAVRASALMVGAWGTVKLPY